MIRIALVLLVSLVTVRTSDAGDSTWLVCKGTAKLGVGAMRPKIHIVASLLEHRGSDGGSRDLSVTLMRGSPTAHGEIVELDAGTFVDESFGLDPDMKPVALTATLTCEILDDLAIGHSSASSHVSAPSTM